MSEMVDELRNEHKQTDTRCRIMCLQAADEIEYLCEKLKAWKDEALKWRERARYDGSEGSECFHCFKFYDANIEARKAQVITDEIENKKRK